MTIDKDAVRLERGDDGVVHLLLQDKDRKNSLSRDLVHLLEERLGELGEDREARVCLVRGLPEVFCAGGDKDMLLALARGEVVPTDILISRAVLEVPMVTVAVMEGHAVGGGLTLGLCCDLVLMARESRYGCSFMNMGFTPGMGTTRLLELAVGPYRAAEMMLGGEMLKGSRFEHTGVNAVMPRADLWRHAEALATRVADKPRYAVELLKRTLATPKRLAFEQARADEALMHELCFGRDETRRRIEDELSDE